MFIIEFLLDEYLLEFGCADPGEELEFELPATEDLVFEADLHLLYLALRLRLHVPRS